MFKILAAILVLLVSGRGLAYEPLRLESAVTPRVNTVNHGRFFFDASKVLSAEQVIQAHGQDFQDVTTAKLGSESGAVWIEVALDNASGTSMDVYLVYPKGLV